MSEVIHVARRILSYFNNDHHPVREYTGLQSVLANGPACLCVCHTNLNVHAKAQKTSSNHGINWCLNVSPKV
jgi:hypothetical protein